MSRAPRLPRAALLPFAGVRLPRAACRGHHDPDLWGEGPPGDPDPMREAAAKAICGGCPERIDCGLWAIEYREVGIWGGMTSRERERIRAQVASVAS